MLCLGRTCYWLATHGRNRLKPRLQRGTSMVELIVAMAVLATAVVGVGRFASTIGRGLRDRELSSRIGWELTNAREQIGAWIPAEITAARIKSLSFSTALAEELQDLRWQAEVVPIADPAQTLQITLALHCSLHGQSASPASLVFWVANQSVSNQDQDQEATRP